MLVEEDGVGTAESIVSLGKDENVLMVSTFTAFGLDGDTVKAWTAAASSSIHSCTRRRSRHGTSTIRRNSQKRSCTRTKRIRLCYSPALTASSHYGIRYVLMEALRLSTVGSTLLRYVIVLFLCWRLPSLSAWMMADDDMNDGGSKHLVLRDDSAQDDSFSTEKFPTLKQTVNSQFSD